MFEFCPDKTEVFFSFLDKAINVSSVFCTIQLPFMSSPLVIRWYGVIIAFGLSLAVLFGGRRAYYQKIDINYMIDVLIYGMLAGIVGARAYYVIAEWKNYIADPSEIFRIWHGGLAIYGGLIGGVIAAIGVCLYHKMNILNLLDICGMSFLIGQGIGRWGNFANQEAFGINTSLPWGMFSEKTQAYLSMVNMDGIDPSAPVHPTFLYESLWCLASFVFLYWFFKKHRSFSGQIFLLYGMLYGLERSVVEGLRTDSLYITGTTLRVSQVVSIALCVVSTVLFVIFTIRYTKKPTLIEGRDYYKEIPVYNKQKKAKDLRAVWEKQQAKADAAEGAKKEKLLALAEKSRKAYEAALPAAEAAEKARREKLLSKGINPDDFVVAPNAKAAMEIISRRKAEQQPASEAE